MSTAPISTSSLVQGAQYFQDRRSDLQQLGQALQSGDLAGAQQDFAAIQNLGKNGPFAGGNAFAVTARQQDFAAVGQALQSGDLAGAQKAFAQLQATFKSGGTSPSTGPANPVSPVPVEPGPPLIINISAAGAAAASAASTTAASSTAAAPAASSTATAPAASSTTGPEIVLNIGNGSAGSSPEEITLSFNNTSAGAEQLTIGVGSQQNPNAQQVTLNFAQNSNEQIILNLLGNTSAASSSSQTSGLNVVA
jgi:hypothetical protein